jgi:hypothetical protein
MGDIAFYTLGITLSASAFAWVANVLYAQYHTYAERRVSRYNEALREFYWPLHMRITELLSYTNKNGDSEIHRGRVTECAMAVMKIVRDKIGVAMPKKHIVEPLQELVAMLAAGLRHNDPTQYINMDILRRIEILVKSRLISMQRKYDSMIIYSDEKGTLDMYEIAIVELRDYLRRRLGSDEIPGYTPAPISGVQCVSSRIRHADLMRKELMRLFDYELVLPKPHREECERRSFDEERGGVLERPPGLGSTGNLSSSPLG